MSEWSSKFCGSITDGHVHMGPISSEGRILAIREACGIDKIGLVSIQDPRTGMGLPQSLYMKAKHPDVFYVFAGLNHGAKLSDGKVVTRSLSDQLDDFVGMGCDGIKMIEGKPTSRQIMDIPVTDGYFADYWAHVEELGLPIVWHVNDPEEFWKPETLPAWARERNWGYGPDDVQKETLYAEVDEVLEKHPDLSIIFAHFYFLSADPGRCPKRDALRRGGRGTGEASRAQHHLRTLLLPLSRSATGEPLLRCTPPCRLRSHPRHRDALQHVSRCRRNA